MAIEQLIDVMSAPATPLEAGGITWLIIESDIGTRLPDDYKAFIERYGSGRINGFIWIFNPFSYRQNINLINQISTQLDTLKKLANEFNESCPYSLFPEEGGLLPLGMTDNGDVIYWLTEGEPAYWKIVVNEARGPMYEEFEGDVTLFLKTILTREIRCKLFPRNFPEGTPTFEAK